MTVRRQIRRNDASKFHILILLIYSHFNTDFLQTSQTDRILANVLPPPSYLFKRIGVVKFPKLNSFFATCGIKHLLSWESYKLLYAFYSLSTQISSSKTFIAFFVTNGNNTRIKSDQVKKGTDSSFQLRDRFLALELRGVLHYWLTFLINQARWG